MELSKQQSLNLITEMIEMAKKSVKADGYYFLLWGWLVFIGGIGHYLLLKFTDYPYPYIVWLIVIPGWILSIIHANRQRRRAIVRTFLNKIIAIVWVLFFINYVIIVFYIHQLNYKINPLVLTIGASAAFLTGYIVKENIVKIGAIFLWIGGIACFYFNQEVQLLIGSISVLLGYIFPAYILKYKYKKENV